MNIKNKKKFKVMLLIGLAMLLVGCTAVTDKNGNTLPHLIIRLSTPFKEIISNEGWFEAFFIWPLSQLINFFAQYTGAAIAIILVTAITRILTLGVTIKSTIAQQKIQLIQPEVLKIQEKYKDRKDDAAKQAQGQELMALYSKHNINPLSSIFTMFLQFPIFIAMWQSVQRAAAVAEGTAETFLGLNLRQTPSSVITTLGENWYAYVILLIVLGAAQYISIKLPQWMAKKDLKPSKRKEAENNATAAQMNMMSNMMTIMILFFSFTLPVAMSFYWLVSSLLQIAQTYFIQKTFVDKR